MKKEKRPTIDEGTKKVILSRIFGESYMAKPNSDNTYIGYFEECIVEVMFYGFFCTIEKRYGEHKPLKFANHVSNAFFRTKGLRATTEERINFDKMTSASIGCYNYSVSFYFWYRFKDKAA